MQPRTRFLPLIAILLVPTACTVKRPSELPDGGPAMGTAEGLCFPNGTCFAGLVCQQGVCKGEGSNPDSGPWVPPDGYGPLRPCAEPGQPCDAKDPCAINPVCDPDGKCRPSQLQRCDDGLPCTTDICKGQGLCEHTPAQGFCVVAEPGKAPACVPDKQKSSADPCQVCDSAHPTVWSPANGGGCDDQNLCTKNDTCQDGVCKGSYYGDLCADSLSCTEDKCDGKGACLPSVLAAGHCLINQQCFKDGDQQPSGCGICDSAKSTSQWTPLSAYCTISGACLKPGAVSPDGCGTCDPGKNATGWTPRTGVCKIGAGCVASGIAHLGGCAECNPQLDPSSWTVLPGACLIDNVCQPSGAVGNKGCGTCDPAKSKTDWTPLADTCLISNLCYAAQKEHPTGSCAECDPASSKTAWTPTGDGCLIDGSCRSSGQIAPQASCASCDPAKSKTTWSPSANSCLIGSKCYAEKALDSSGCLTCNSSTNPKSWTPLPGVSQVSYGFEDGKNPPVGWTVQNSDSAVGWVVSTRRPGDGSYSLYYGNPATGNYSTGSLANSGTATLPSLTIAPGKKAVLSFLLWKQVEISSNFDLLIVEVNGFEVWDASGLSNNAWHAVTVDLSTFAGQTVSVTFRFDSVDGTSNKTEGVYLDDVAIFHGC